MAQKLSPNELVTFKELLMANSIQTDALAQLLIDRGNWRSYLWTSRKRIKFQVKEVKHEI